MPLNKETKSNQTKLRKITILDGPRPFRRYPCMQDLIKKREEYSKREEF